MSLEVFEKSKEHNEIADRIIVGLGLASIVAAMFCFVIGIPGMACIFDLSTPERMGRTAADCASSAYVASWIPWLVLNGLATFLMGAFGRNALHHGWYTKYLVMDACVTIINISFISYTIFYGPYDILKIVAYAIGLAIALIYFILFKLLEKKYWDAKTNGEDPHFY